MFQHISHGFFCNRSECNANELKAILYTTFQVFFNDILSHNTGLHNPYYAIVQICSNNFSQYYKSSLWSYICCWKNTYDYELKYISCLFLLFFLYLCDSESYQETVINPAPNDGQLLGCRCMKMPGKHFANLCVAAHTWRNNFRVIYRCVSFYYKGELPFYLLFNSFIYYFC